MFGSCVQSFVDHPTLVLTSFWRRCRGLKKMNLNINIITKERIANLNIFLYFIINSIKLQN